MGHCRILGFKECLLSGDDYDWSHGTTNEQTKWALSRRLSTADSAVGPRSPEADSNCIRAVSKAGMAETLTQKWLRQNLQTYLHADRVFADIDATLSRFPTLRPKTDAYSTLSLCCMPLFMLNVGRSIR